MRNLIRAMVLMSAMALSACGGGGTGDSSNELATSAGSSREFVLDYGETVDLGALSLEFTGVTDGRCGVGSSAVCVWEGNAQVFITATEGQASQILTLNTSLQFPPSAVFAGHLIELRRLDPLPTYADTGRPGLEDYSATLFVDGVP